MIDSTIPLTMPLSQATKTMKLSLSSFTLEVDMTAVCYLSSKEQLHETAGVLDLEGIDLEKISIYVTSFSSIPYCSNVRLISKMYLEQNSHTLDIHTSTNKRPPHLFSHVNRNFVCYFIIRM